MKEDMKLTYEVPESRLMTFPAESAICTGSPDKPGETMEEGGYWYEY